MSRGYPASPFGEGGSRRLGDPETPPDAARNTPTKPAQLAALRELNQRPVRLIGNLRVYGHGPRATVSGIVVNAEKLMTGASGPWIAMPARKQLDRDGDPRFDATGKLILNQIIESADCAATIHFQGMVLELICRGHLEALDGWGAP